MGATAGIVSGAIGIMGAGAAQRRAADDRRRAQGESDRLKGELRTLENSRQPVINPYADVTDTSGQLTNTYANLGVATEAAKFQSEQADISLANTLDTLRATGASAGGATALAQAALQSKKQVSSSIQLQEAQNQKLYAQGEERLNQAKMQEEQRLQSAGVMGKQFMFGTTEQREVAELNRTAGMLDNAQQDLRVARAGEAKAEAQMYSAVGQVAGGVTSFISDRRAKQNIKLIGYSPSGLKIYNFEYINKIFGEGIFQGVMTDEIPSYAVVKNENGFDRVNYSKIDVEFKKIK